MARVNDRNVGHLGLVKQTLVVAVLALGIGFLLGADANETLLDLVCRRLSVRDTAGKEVIRLDSNGNVEISGNLKVTGDFQPTPHKGPATNKDINVRKGGWKSFTPKTSWDGPGGLISATGKWRQRDGSVDMVVRVALTAGSGALQNAVPNAALLIEPIVPEGYQLDVAPVPQGFNPNTPPFAASEHLEQVGRGAVRVAANQLPMGGGGMSYLITVDLADNVGIDNVSAVEGRYWLVCMSQHPVLQPLPDQPVAEATLTSTNFNGKRLPSVGPSKGFVELSVTYRLAARKNDASTPQDSSN